MYKAQERAFLQAQIDELRDNLATLIRALDGSTKRESNLTALNTLLQENITQLMNETTSANYRASATEQAHAATLAELATANSKLAALAQSTETLKKELLLKDRAIAERKAALASQKQEISELEESRERDSDNYIHMVRLLSRWNLESVLPLYSAHLH